MRTTKVRFSYNILNGILFYFFVVGDVTRNDIKYLYRDFHRTRISFWNAITEAIVLFGVSVPFAIWNIKSWLIYWQIPRLLGSYLLVSVNYIQHDGCDIEPNSFDTLSKENINYARNFVGNWINFWAFNNGYHSIHHIHPKLHWSCLPEAHEKEIAPMIDSLLIQSNMATYIFKTFIYPGNRIRYDGTPIVFPENDEDQPWFQMNREE